MRFKLASSLFLLLLFGSNVTDGQVLGPELKTGKLEIGGFWKQFHRKMDPNFPLEHNWSRSSIFMKYGINRFITLSAEGAVYNVKDNTYPERNYRDYIIGAGIISRIFDINEFRMALSFHYNEIFSFDRAPYESGHIYTFHSNTRGVIGVIQVEKSFSFHSQNVTLWIANAYIFDEYIFYSSWDFIPYTYKSVDNFGFILGVNLMLFKHIEPFFHIVYADFFQPRVGIGYQF